MFSPKQTFESQAVQTRLIPTNKSYTLVLNGKGMTKKSHLYLVWFLFAQSTLESEQEWSKLPGRHAVTAAVLLGTALPENKL